MRAWANHFALNVGALFGCLIFGILPPQWTGHTKRDIERLRRDNPLRLFWQGLRGDSDEE